MALADRQRLLARLATDAALRAQWAADPGGLVRSLGLGPDDAAWLAALPADAVADFADSLIHKRRGEAAKLLPATARALGPARFAERFARHAAGRPIPDGPRRHLADALAFAASAMPGPGDPPWLADLIRWEAAGLAALDPARRWSACRLGYRPGDLLRAAGSGVLPGRRPTLVVWFRVARRGRLRRFEVGVPGRPAVEGG